MSAALHRGVSAIPLGPNDSAADVAVRCELLDPRGVDQAIVIASHDLRPDGIADNQRVNDGIATYRDACPGPIPCGVGIVEPLKRRARSCRAGRRWPHPRALRE